MKAVRWDLYTIGVPKCVNKCWNRRNKILLQNPLLFRERKWHRSRCSDVYIIRASIYRIEIRSCWNSVSYYNWSLYQHYSGLFIFAFLGTFVLVNNILERPAMWDFSFDKSSKKCNQCYDTKRWMLFKFTQYVWITPCLSTKLFKFVFAVGFIRFLDCDIRWDT